MDIKLNQSFNSFTTPLIAVESNSINSLSDDEWSIVDPTKSGEASMYTLDWSNRLPSLDANLLIAFKQHLRHILTQENDGSLQGTSQKVCTYVGRYKWVAETLNKSGLSFISDINEGSIFDFFKTGLYDEGRNAIYRSSHFAKVLALLVDMTTLTQSGVLHTGPLGVVDWQTLAQGMKPFVEAEGEDFLEWMEGGTMGSVPIAVTCVVVDEAIKLMHSDEARMAVAMYKWYRSIWPNIPIPDTFYDLHKPYVNGHYRRYEYRDTLRTFIQAEFKDISKENLDFVSPSFAFKSGIKFHEFVRKLYIAGAVIFLALSGARRSEIASIRCDGLKKDKNGNYRFKSKIFKTNHGIPTMRYISGEVAKVVDVLKELCVTDKSTKNSLLFEGAKLCWGVNRDEDSVRRSINPKPCKRFVNSHEGLVRDWRHYFIFIAKKYPLLSEHIADINPHQFRHTFAELAMRRFDGNIPEALRRHFQHHWNSYMTGRYTKGKVTMAQYGIQLEYLASLMGQYADKSINLKLAGPIARILMDAVDGIEFVSFEESKEMLMEIVEQFSHIEVHAYSLCAVHRDQISLAKCYEAESGLKTGKAQWGLCGGCANRLTTDYNLNNLLLKKLGIEVCIKEYSKLEGADDIVKHYKKLLKPLQATIRELDPSTEGTMS